MSRGPRPDLTFCPVDPLSECALLLYEPFPEDRWRCPCHRVEGTYRLLQHLTELRLEVNRLRFQAHYGGFLSALERCRRCAPKSTANGPCGRCRVEDLQLKIVRQGAHIRTALELALAVVELPRPQQDRWWLELIADSVARREMSFRGVL